MECSTGTAMTEAFLLSSLSQVTELTAGWGVQDEAESSSLSSSRSSSFLSGPRSGADASWAVAAMAAGGAVLSRAL